MARRSRLLIEDDDNATLVDDESILLPESALEPAKTILEDRDSWRQSLDTSLQSIDANYDTTYSDLKAELEVLQAEAVTEDDADKAHEGLRKALSSRSIWKEDRQKSSRKAGAALQRWLNAFAGFLESYSGIVEVVKAADQQYGGLAYGTLSVLLGVAVNKDQQEDMIEDALEEFALAFPRLQRLKQTYLSPQSEALWRLVGAVYAEVIIFAREATIYYQKSSFRKITETMLHPPKTKVSKNVALIRKHLAEIRWESETLMQHRLMEMAQENRTLQAKVDELIERENTKQRNEDQRNLKELRSILKFKESDKHTNIQHYKRLLDSAFADRRYGREEPSLMNWEILAEDDSFQRWWNIDSSSLLFLSGKNWITVNNSTLSWLSYAAVLLTQKLLQENRNVAYYFCQADNMLTDRRRRTIQDLMANLLYQIANSQPKLLRSGIETIRDAITSDEWNSEDEEVALEAMANLLVDVLSSLDLDEEFTLVIDRIDQCRWSSESEESGSGIENALFWLLHVIREVPCAIKIVVITYSISTGNLSHSVRSRLQKRGGERYIERTDWHQESETSRSVSPPL